MVAGDDGDILGVRGIHALAGIVLRMLLTTPGSWPGQKSEGSVLAQIPGGNVDAMTLKTDVLRSVAQVESHLKVLQLRKSYPPAESLSSLEVTEIVFPTLDVANVKILIRNLSGEILQTVTAIEA